MDDTFSRIVGFGFATFICFWIAYSQYRLSKTADPSHKSDGATVPGCLSFLFVRKQGNPTEVMWGFLVLAIFFLLALILTIVRSG